MLSLFDPTWMITWVYLSEHLATIPFLHEPKTNDTINQ